MHIGLLDSFEMWPAPQPYFLHDATERGGRARMWPVLRSDNALILYISIVFILLYIIVSSI